MTKRTTPFYVLPMFAVVAVAFLALTQTQAGVVERRSAQYLYFGTTAPPAEAFTTAAALAGGAGGLTIYTKTVAIKPGEKVMYVTVSAAGDTHGGAGLLISCLVDGVVCNAGDGGGSATPSGWIRINKMPKPSSGGCNAGLGDGSGGAGDCHDNAVPYTWCKAIEPPNGSVNHPKGPTTRTVKIKIASSDGTNLVFIEDAHFYIDLQQGSASGTDTPTCIAGAP